MKKLLLITLLLVPGVFIQSKLCAAASSRSMNNIVQADEECPICRVAPEDEEGSDSGQLLKTDCGHFIHNDCLVNWVAHKNVNNVPCVICRQLNCSTVPAQVAPKAAEPKNDEERIKMGLTKIQEGSAGKIQMIFERLSQKLNAKYDVETLREVVNQLCDVSEEHGKSKVVVGHATLVEINQLLEPMIKLAIEDLLNKIGPEQLLSDNLSSSLQNRLFTQTQVPVVSSNNSLTGSEPYLVQPAPINSTQPQNSALSVQPEEPVKAQDNRLVCRYAPYCTRKNPRHWQEFNHKTQQQPVGNFSSDVSSAQPQGPVVSSNNSLAQPQQSENDNRPVCKHGAACYRKSADHLKQFQHPNQGNANVSSAQPQGPVVSSNNSLAQPQQSENDNRPDCKWAPRCTRHNLDHWKEYKHPGQNKPASK